MTTENILEKVVAELSSRTGELRKVATESGIAYDTILRIKNREGDPGFGKVDALYRFLFIGAPIQKAVA